MLPLIALIIGGWLGWLAYTQQGIDIQVRFESGDGEHAVLHQLDHARHDGTGIASILVPTFKLVGIGLLLFSVQRHQPLSAQQRIVMYRFIEFIGRWSMLDIFVIAILVAVVNFGRLASVEANLGAAAFASVVILTMLAAVTFDPRLIWDNTESDDDHE